MANARRDGPPDGRQADAPEFLERLSSAPWVICSMLIHMLALILFSSIVWRDLGPERSAAMLTAWLGPETSEVVSPAQPMDELEPDPDALERLEDVELIEEDTFSDPVEDPPEELEGDGYMAVDGPFSAEAEQSFTGVFGAASGKFGARRRGAASYSGSAGMSRALADGLEWLARHQSEDGSWDSDRFMKRGLHGPCDCSGAGGAKYDVGMTSLALLAFLGAGNSTAGGPYRDAVARGVRWLRERQDPDSGLVGERNAWSHMYGHALATMALCEAYHATKSPLLKRNCVTAVQYIQRARNPYSAWRYESPPNGESDTSVTGWMIFALATAAAAGLEVDPGALDAGLAWIEGATDREDGRVGYVSPGGAPRGGRGETMTAVGLLCRIFLADLGRPSDDRIVDAHTGVLLRDLPRWGRSNARVDMYYWYYGTYAMYQVGGKPWRAWETALESAVVKSQERTGHARGSWDPVGTWGGNGGRVYSTALMTMCLEVYFRYERVLGAR